jgi:hypothetical protein
MKQSKVYFKKMKKSEKKVKGEGCRVKGAG